MLTDQVKNIHIISIGGSVMHDLAITLKKLGNIVTGSDDIILSLIHISEPTRPY